MPPPDITRLFKGARNEFEVEVVFANDMGSSPKESHPFHELIVVTEGSISIERDGKKDDSIYKPFSLIEIPAGVEHVISAEEPPTKVVVIHPKRIVE